MALTLTVDGLGVSGGDLGEEGGGRDMLDDVLVVLAFFDAGTDFAAWE